MVDLDLAQQWRREMNVRLTAETRVTTFGCRSDMPNELI